MRLQLCKVACLSLRNMAPNTAARLIHGIQKKYECQCRPAKHCRTFPVNSTYCGLGCFSWNTLCCYLHEKMFIMRLIIGPAVSQSSRQLISLSSSWRHMVLNLFCSQFGIQRRKVNQGYLLFSPPLNLVVLRQRGGEGCALFVACWGSSQWRWNQWYWLSVEPL